MLTLTLAGVLALSGLAFAVLLCRYFDTLKNLEAADDLLDGIEADRQAAADSGFEERWRMCDQCKGERVDSWGGKCSRCKGVGRLLVLASLTSEQELTIEIIQERCAELEKMREESSRLIDEKDLLLKEADRVVISAGERVAELEAEVEIGKALIRPKLVRIVNRRPDDPLEVHRLNMQAAISGLGLGDSISIQDQRWRFLSLGMPASMLKKEERGSFAAAKVAADQMAELVGSSGTPRCICGIQHSPLIRCKDARPM